MVNAKKYIFCKEWNGMPTKENFKIVVEKLPELQDGEFLTEAVYFSVDPYMRFYTIELGTTMIGTQVAKIVKSKSTKYPVGKYVVGDFGWRTHTIRKDDVPRNHWNLPQLVPFEADVPLSLALGMLGMPGNTAYFGFLEICKPQPGETVIVSGAAGAIGSHVGQIAKIIGCTVIGIAGSDEKIKWLKSLGFDTAINYKTGDSRKALAEAAPKGIDCYFDNVGGETSSIVLKQMNPGGRISVCGAISSYTSEDEPKATMVQHAMISNRLRMSGFWVSEWLDRWQEGISQNLKWILEGKLKYKETITEGFENLPKALIGVMAGQSTGKAIVKV